MTFPKFSPLPPPAAVSLRPPSPDVMHWGPKKGSAAWAEPVKSAGPWPVPGRPGRVLDPGVKSDYFGLLQPQATPPTPAAPCLISLVSPPRRPKTPPRRLLIVFFSASVFQCLFRSIFFRFSKPTWRQLGLQNRPKSKKNQYQDAFLC